MRKLAAVTCVALALVGCSVRESRPTTSNAVRASLPSARLADGTTENSARPAGERSSHGSATFGRVVRSHEPQLQFCYGETRVKHPKLAGSATVAVTLATNGTVRNAEIVRRAWSGKGSAGVEECMLSRVRAWSFPPLDPSDVHVHSFSVIFTR